MEEHVDEHSEVVVIEQSEVDSDCEGGSPGLVSCIWTGLKESLFG
jgi:hypothetical protein